MKRKFGFAVGLLLTVVVCLIDPTAAWAGPGEEVLAEEVIPVGPGRMVPGGPGGPGGTPGSNTSYGPGYSNSPGGLGGPGGQQKPPERKISVQVSAEIELCQVTPDQQFVLLRGNSGGSTANTDGKLYLFELEPYENEIGNKSYVWSTQAGGPFVCQLPLGWPASPDRMYNRFVAAVYAEGQYVMVSSPYYIENPESVARNQQAFFQPSTKKGLRIQLDLVGDALELGVKHAGTDIMFQQILGSGIDFSYGGKIYHFNRELIEQYDRAISAFTNNGVSVTAVILNGWDDRTPDLVYPGITRSDQAYHYMFNVASEAGYEQTRAIAAFLAQRYNGANPACGKIANWVIGNEVNNQRDWNYMGPANLETYVKTYLEAFRVFYTAIKTNSANDRVYMSLDYHWNNESDGWLRYNGKDIVDTFNAMAKEGGQFDWGLAYHPYPYPMTEPEFWDDDQSGLINNTFHSPIINFKNLTTLTNYFAQDGLRMKDGSVRPIILTEQGFTARSATRGEVPDIQAAAFAYSYYLVDSNPYIQAYLLSRQVDGPAEVVLGISQGLWECDMSQPYSIVATVRRPIWNVFQKIDQTDGSLESTEFAKEIIGIQKWSDVIPGFRWGFLEQ